MVNCHCLDCPVTCLIYRASQGGRVVVIGSCKLAVLHRTFARAACSRLVAVISATFAFMIALFELFVASTVTSFSVLVSRY